MAGNTDIITAACVFLDKLKQLHENGYDLPVPFVMSGIRVLLQEKLPSRPSTATSRSVKPWVKGGSRNEYQQPPRKTARRHQRTAEFGEAARTPECVNASVYVIPYRRQQQIARFDRDIRALESLDAPVYVDVQWLKSNRGYVIKEFAAMCVGTPTAWMIIKSPSGATPNEWQNGYLENRVHGINWDVGFIDERQLRAMTSNLFGKKRRVLVKGTQKADILAEKLNVERRFVETLDDCPDSKCLLEMYTVPACLYHSRLDRIMSCAAKNVRAIVNHYDVENWIDKELY